MRRERRSCSGGAPGGKAAKFGGPVRSGRSSIETLGSGRFRLICDFGGGIFSGLPRPEIPLFGLGLPPLMLIPSAPFPAPPVSFEPLALFAELGEPFPAAFDFPSGEIATRAARLPCGTGTTGAGAAGVAESAINVLAEFPAASEDDAATSGAGASSA